MKDKYDPGFGKVIDWDIPLLDGYDYTFVQNVSSKPGSNHFRGIDNPSLIQEIENWSPDAILVFGWSFKSHLKLMRYFKGKKEIFFRGDSNLLDETNQNSFKTLIRRFFLRFVYRSVDKALYVGSNNKNYYSTHGLKGHQLVFAPHAIDNQRFSNSYDGVTRLQIGIPTSAFVFLFAGKFEIKKNPYLLLDAFIQIANPNCHLLLVGSGSLELGLKSKVATLPISISNRIHFLPFQNQTAIPAVYQLCDVFVLPSKGPGETWGLSINEAMACSKPVLVSDQCGAAVDLVKNGKNGYIFKSNDGVDLLSKMEVFLSKHDLLDQMGRYSYHLIQAWNFDNICSSIEQLLV
jgi:glycosyltransferase involved in cell wall biosynthesis